MDHTGVRQGQLQHAPRVSAASIRHRLGGRRAPACLARPDSMARLGRGTHGTPHAPIAALESMSTQRGLVHVWARPVQQASMDVLARRRLRLQHVCRARVGCSRLRMGHRHVRALCAQKVSLARWGVITPQPRPVSNVNQAKSPLSLACTRALHVPMASTSTTLGRPCATTSFPDAR